MECQSTGQWNILCKNGCWWSDKYPEIDADKIEIEKKLHNYTGAELSVPVLFYGILDFFFKYPLNLPAIHD